MATEIKPSQLYCTADELRFINGLSASRLEQYAEAFKQRVNFDGMNAMAIADHLEERLHQVALTQETLPNVE